MSITPMFPGPFISSGVISGGGGGGGNVTAVNSMSGTNSICSGSNTCAYTFPNNPTSGNNLVLSASVNHGGATLSISSLSGSGCPASFTLVTSIATPDSSNVMYVWTGKAAGSGSCTANLATGGYFSNWELAEGEYTGGLGVVDAYGSAAYNTGTSLNITAGNATTATNDYGVVSWVSNTVSLSPSASGWTSKFNENYLGAFEQGSIANGTTVNFAGTFSGGETMGIMVILK